MARSTRVALLVLAVGAMLLPVTSGRATAPASTVSTLTPAHDHAPGFPAHPHGPSVSVAGRAADPACPEPLVTLRPEALGGVVCVHGGDPATDIQAMAAPPIGRLTAGAASPVCFGDGKSGERVQLLYLHMTGGPNRFAQFRTTMRDVWARNVDALVRSTSKEQGRELAIRFQTENCVPTIESLEVSAAVGSTEPDIFTQFERIIDAMAKAGYGSTDRKYMVWFDGPAGSDSRAGGQSGVCGIASGFIYDTGTPFGVSDTPVANLHAGLMSMTSLTFAHPSKRLTAFNCWGIGKMGAHTEIHELFHTMGAVQASSPNSNRLSHCLDGPDVMCYDEFGFKVYTRCSGAAQRLDCNGDDYFNVNPAPGSYLSTHWNTAASPFLGSALLDGSPIVVRRP